jgi:hypothetical protein
MPLHQPPSGPKKVSMPVKLVWRVALTIGFLDTPAPAPAAATASPTNLELAKVGREQARETMQRLVDGYQDKSGSSYGPAVRNEAGCVLAQKAPNRAVSISQWQMLRTNTGQC